MKKLGHNNHFAVVCIAKPCTNYLFAFVPLQATPSPLLSSTRPLPVVQNNALLPKKEFLYDHFVKGIAAEKLPNCFYLPNEFW